MNRTLEDPSRDLCVACGAEAWLALPSPLPDRSVTTSGVVVHEPVGKSHCTSCGFVQRTERPYLGLGDFYEKEYEDYYERPGTYEFNRERYMQIAGWVVEALDGFVPERVLEVGCGRGWTLMALREFFPDASLEGIEPSETNAAVAREHGFDVRTGKMAAGTDIGEYDVVFSNHVIQHTTDPHDFLTGCARAVSGRGFVIHTIQDASIPTNELMFSDQNFSFLPHHLVDAVRRGGLEVSAWNSAPDIDGLMFSQMVVGRRPQGDGGGREGGADPVPVASDEALETLYRDRKRYFEAWRKLDEFLAWQVEGSSQVYHFGAGMFSYQISCYCPTYWDRVDICTIDGGGESFKGKDVWAFQDLELGPGDALVLGTRPFIQGALREGKLGGVPARVVAWDNFMVG